MPDSRSESNLDLWINLAFEIKSGLIIHIIFVEVSRYEAGNAGSGIGNGLGEYITFNRLQT